MSGTSAIYSTEPRLRALRSIKNIVSVAGANPIDLGDITLPNIRGAVEVRVLSTDTNHVSSFQVVGGYGAWPGEPTLNWYFSTGTNVGCTVSTLFTNRIQIVTPVIDAGGRTYVFNFSPIASFPPSITQTSANILGAADVTVTLSKTVLNQ